MLCIQTGNAVWADPSIAYGPEEYTEGFSLLSFYSLRLTPDAA